MWLRPPIQVLCLHGIIYNNPKAPSGELVDYLLGGTTLNYIGHRACVHKASAGVRKERKHVDMTDLARKKELEGGQERNLTHRATVNGTWVSTVPHILNRMELSQEELQDNLRLRHGLMPQ